MMQSTSHSRTRPQGLSLRRPATVRDTPEQVEERFSVRGVRACQRRIHFSYPVHVSGIHGNVELSHARLRHARSDTLRRREGVNCTKPGKTCSVTGGDIAHKIDALLIGVPDSQVTFTLTTDSGAAT